MKNILVTICFLTCMSCTALFAQTTLKWESVATTMPVPVSYGQAVVKDSLIYILGGYSSTLTNHYQSVIQEYNPASNTWRIVDNMQNRRVGFVVQKIGDSLAILGGVIGSSGRSSLEIWNFKTRPTIRGNYEAFSRYYFGSAIYNTKLFLFGGSGFLESPPMHDYLVEYDLRTNQPTYTNDSIFSPANMPYEQMVCVQDSIAYLFGGGQGSFILADVYQFNMLNREFKKSPYRMPEPKKAGALVNIGAGKMLLTGGRNESARALNRTILFSIGPTGIAAVEGPKLIEGRHGHMSVRYKNVVYVFGGENKNFTTIGSVEKMDLLIGIDNPPAEVAEEYQLHDNYPNPFNPSTNISFTTKQAGSVRIEIFDILGRQVKELVTGYYTAGTHTIQWNADDNQGGKVTSGVYLCRLQINNKVFTKKMLYVQ